MQIQINLYRLSKHYRLTIIVTKCIDKRINAQSQVYSYFVRINHLIFTKSGCKYPHAKRTFVYTVHSRFLRAHSAHSVSFNICSSLIDFTSRCNETYFHCRHHCALRFLPRLHPRYLSCIYPIVSPYCTVFFRRVLPRGHNKPPSFAAVCLRCVPILAGMSRGMRKVVVVCLVVIVSIYLRNSH